MICPDGELYELSISFVAPSSGYGGGMERVEKLEKLDLPPLEYIFYAYNALAKLSRLMSKADVLKPN